MEPTSGAAGVGLFAGIIGGLGGLKQLLERGDVAAAKAQLATLSDNMLQAVGQNGDLLQELHEAQRRIRELEEALARKEQLVHDETDLDKYWITNKLGDGVETAPACKPCWDGDGKLARMTPMTWNDKPTWRCPVCEKRAQRAQGGPPGDVGGDRTQVAVIARPRRPRGMDRTRKLLGDVYPE